MGGVQRELLLMVLLGGGVLTWIPVGGLREQLGRTGRRGRQRGGRALAERGQVEVGVTTATAGITRAMVVMVMIHAVDRHGARRSCGWLGSFN